MKKLNRYIVATALFLGGSLCIAGEGNPTYNQTYDIDPVACEGLSLDGVLYSFSIAGVPSNDCLAGTFIGPNITDNIEAPNIEGNSAGVLHLTFDVPTTKFGFGVAVNTFSSPQIEAVTVNLNRPGSGMLREQVQLDLTNDPGFVGGRYEYNGPAVKTITLQFDSVNRFSVDNVTYFRPPGKVK